VIEHLRKKVVTKCSKKN